MLNAREGGAADGAGTVVPSGEVVEARVFEAGRAGESSRGRRAWRLARPLAVILAVAIASGFASGYAGAGLVAGLAEAAEAGSSPGPGTAAAQGAVHAASATPVGSVAVAANGMKAYVSGSFVTRAKGGQGAPMLVVALEMQNLSKEAVVLRNWQITALDADGRELGAAEETICRTAAGDYVQLTSTCVEPGETVSVNAAFFQAANPVRLVYDPNARARGSQAPCSVFEVGPDPGAVLA